MTEEDVNKIREYFGKRPLGVEIKVIKDDTMEHGDPLLLLVDPETYENVKADQENNKEES